MHQESLTLHAHHIWILEWQSAQGLKALSCCSWTWFNVINISWLCVTGVNWYRRQEFLVAVFLCRWSSTANWLLFWRDSCHWWSVWWVYFDLWLFECNVCMTVRLFLGYCYFHKLRVLCHCLKSHAPAISISSLLEDLVITPNKFLSGKKIISIAIAAPAAVF